MVFVRLKPNLNQIPPHLPSYVYNWNDLYIFFNSSSGSPCSLIERRKTVQASNEDVLPSRPSLGKID